MTDPDYGETWTYESLVGALPGVDVPRRVALAVQFGAFEVATLAVALYYDRPAAGLAGTVAVLVATVGSVEMLRIARQIRTLPVSESYRRLLFGSNVETVLAVLAYVALVTYLFVFEPPRASTPLVEALLGPDPPVLATYLLLLVLWDVCYRIGTGWWTSVVALWRSLTQSVDPRTARALVRADVETVGFGLVQLAFLPFVRDRPVLVAVLVGHVLAVVVVAGAAAAILWTTRT
ncbi:MAG: hypothetical protein ABEJ23_04390 [Haloarculaceae archaeon]